MVKHVNLNKFFVFLKNSRKIDLSTMRLYSFIIILLTKGVNISKTIFNEAVFTHYYTSYERCKYFKNNFQKNSQKTFKIFSKNFKNLSFVIIDRAIKNHREVYIFNQSNLLGY